MGRDLQRYRRDKSPPLAIWGIPNARNEYDADYSGLTVCKAEFLSRLIVSR
jgi:hypothetical protein